MKKLISILLFIIMVCSLFTSCSPKTKGEAEKEQLKQQESSENRDPIHLDFIAMASLETEANVVRDQLKKAGFDVSLSLQPDYGSLFTQVEARNWDIQMGTYRVLTGNPDYGIRSLFRSDGEDNYGVVKDDEVDRLIDLGSLQLLNDAVATYSELEKVLVEENAYFVPVVRMMYIYGYNQEIIKNSTVDIGQSKYLYWTELDYNNESDRETKPLLLSSNRAIGHFDPVTQDGTFRILSNTNIKLMELKNNDELTTDGALSQGYAIADGNSDFYFVLRDNINFSTSVDKKAVDTGIMVGADDVIFTVNRLKDKNAVPGHKVYDNYNIIKDAVKVTDINELESVKESGSDKTIKEVLEKSLGTSIRELATTKETTDNKSGKYEVVKLTTTKPFPQVLNYFCTYESGILSEKQVSKINNFDVSKFDPNIDSRYGDVKFLKDGATYTPGHLYCSGPYTVCYLDDYQVVCESNPGYMADTDKVPKIKTVITKLISDPDATVSALRSGEIYLVEDVPSNLVGVVEGDSKLGMKFKEINGIVNVYLNLDDNKVTSNMDVRKAILYSVNQEEVIAVKDGMGGRAYSTLTMIDTGNVHNADPSMVKEYLNSYYKSIGK